MFWKTETFLVRTKVRTPERPAVAIPGDLCVLQHCAGLFKCRWMQGVGVPINEIVRNINPEDGSFYLAADQ